MDRNNNNKRKREEEEDEEDEEHVHDAMAAASAVIACAQAVAASLESIERQPYRGEGLRGRSKTERIIGVSDFTCRAIVRMNRYAFFNLCAIVRERGFLSDSRHITLEEQMCILFNTLGNEKNRQLVHLFSHSGQIVSRYVNLALNAIIKLWSVLLQPLSTTTPRKIRDNPGTYYPYFKDCIGAIDGTHIPAWVPTTDHQRFCNRFGSISQNVLAACDFDMYFTYILAGWEGSASDSRILDNAVSRDGEAKLVVPPGKYYLVDAGFANQLGFLKPYRNVRYHLKEWRNTNQPPVNKKELFNMRHSQLRNIIERAFGSLKARFKILKNQAEYSFSTQVKIVTACALLNNYILKHGQMDDDDRLFASEAAAEGVATAGQVCNAVGGDEGDDDVEVDSDVEDEETVDWDGFRENIATQMWNDWVAVGEESDAST